MKKGIKRSSRSIKKKSRWPEHLQKREKKEEEKD